MSRTVSDSLGSYKKSNIQLVQLCLSKMERQNIWLRVYWGYILCPESQYGVLTQIFYRTSHSYLEFAKLKSQTNKVHFAKNTLRTNILQYFGQIHFGRKYKNVEEYLSKLWKNWNKVEEKLSTLRIYLEVQAQKLIMMMTIFLVVQFKGSSEIHR